MPGDECVCVDWPELALGLLSRLAMTQICWNLLSLRKWQWPKEMDDLIGPRPADGDPAGRQTCCQLQLIEQKIRQIGARPARLADEETDWHLACGTGKWMRLQPAGNRTDLQMTKLTDKQPDCQMRCQTSRRASRQAEQRAGRPAEQMDIQAD